MKAYHLDACVTIFAETPEEAITKLHVQMIASMNSLPEPFKGEIDGTVELGEVKLKNKTQVKDLH